MTPRWFVSQLTNQTKRRWTSLPGGSPEMLICISERAKTSHTAAHTPAATSATPKTELTWMQSTTVQWINHMTEKNTVIAKHAHNRNYSPVKCKCFFFGLRLLFERLELLSGSRHGSWGFTQDCVLWLESWILDPELKQCVCLRAFPSKTKIMVNSTMLSPLKHIVLYSST